MTAPDRETLAAAVRDGLARYPYPRLSDVDPDAYAMLVGGVVDALLAGPLAPPTTDWCSIESHEHPGCEVGGYIRYLRTIYGTTKDLYERALARLPAAAPGPDGEAVERVRAWLAEPWGASSTPVDAICDLLAAVDRLTTQLLRTQAMADAWVEEAGTRAAERDAARDLAFRAAFEPEAAEAAELVRALAGEGEPLDEHSLCVLCHEFGHAVTCPYRLARIWVAVNG